MNNILKADTSELNQRLTLRMLVSTHYRWKRSFAVIVLKKKNAQ